MAWLFLAGAIGFEVAATLSLRMATHGRKLWFVAVIAGYIVAFTMLALALDAGMALGVGYGIWGACGVVITAVASALLFGEAPTPPMGAGIPLIMGGVLLVEVGSRPKIGADPRVGPEVA